MTAAILTKDSRVSRRALCMTLLVFSGACHDMTGPKRSCKGAQLLFSQTGFPSGSQVETANGDGSGQALLQTNPGARAAAWSPDGCLIAYTANTQLFIANADGSNAHVIYTGAAAQDVLDYPSWHPDGRVLLFTKGYGFGARVWRIRRDGLLAAPLTSDTVPTWSASWSSDGKLVAYVRAAGKTSTAPMRLVVIDMDRKVSRIVSDDANLGPAWIPGMHRVTYGHSIATPSGTNGGELRSVNADGTDDRLIAGALSYPFDLTWTSAGDTLYFVAPGAITQNFESTSNVYLIKADGSGFAEVIAGNPSALRPNARR
jgi:hypothetical protein